MKKKGFGGAGFRKFSRIGPNIEKESSTLVAEEGAGRLDKKKEKRKKGGIPYENLSP